jgi:hypothetical protein
MCGRVLGNISVSVSTYFCVLRGGGGCECMLHGELYRQAVGEMETGGVERYHQDAPFCTLTLWVPRGGRDGWVSRAHEHGSTTSHDSLPPCILRLDCGNYK